MSDPETVEVWIAMDKDGSIAVSIESADSAVEAYEGDFGSQVLRVAKINVTMRPPEVPEASVTVPDDSGNIVGAST